MSDKDRAAIAADAYRAEQGEDPWEWTPDGPEAHAMLEQIQAEEEGE